MTRKIKIFDTTLRDGEQAPGCSMDLEEKLSVARQLETLGVDIIEAGFALSSPGDFESVRRIAQTVKNCTVASLARAVKKDIDIAYEAVREAVNPRIHLFIATSPIHMHYKLKKSPEDVLATAVEMVRYAKRHVSDVEFSCEDATRSERVFLATVLKEVIKAGATTVNIPDTVGYATPAEMAELISWLRAHVEGIDTVDLSVHCHNDLGLAVANSLAGVYAGATQVECTVNGVGERAGNAALEELVMALNTRADHYACGTRLDTTQIYRTSRLVYSMIGQTVPLNKPVVGTNAFLHESGIHQHGMLAERSTYEIMTPESVGIPVQSMVLGKHSGRHAFATRLSELGYALTAAEIDAYFETFKQICDKKKTVSDSDLEAIVHNSAFDNTARYRLENFDVHSGKESTAVSVICLGNGKGSYEEVSLGDGPIDAAYNAIDKILNMGTNELVTYSINATSDGKDALGEVVVKLRNGERAVIGRGLSTDIIESSILAYLNAANKLLEMR
ncbi:MAG: 2-isopropylmalate synthase [Coriobacteriia bacterium]|nr:2-isopropylmalate synthase [Coriobacteriia bacterium]